eukprot:6187803-Pleurochrysis_carterae.AAC.2
MASTQHFKPFCAHRVQPHRHLRASENHQLHLLQEQLAKLFARLHVKDILDGTSAAAGATTIIAISATTLLSQRLAVNARCHQTDARRIQHDELANDRAGCGR